MSGCIYRFECVSAEIVMSPAQTAEKILFAATYYVRGIRFHELTDRRNPKPLFAVLFAHHAAKKYFEEMLECLLERSGLRADVLTPIEEELLRELDPATGAANASEFEQRGVEHDHHHPIPPSLKEWVRANSQ